MINEKIIVKNLIYLNNKTRLEAMKIILNAYKINYKLENCGESCTNIIINDDCNEDYTLLVAHYDTWGNSLGINDNTCSIAVLINLVEYIKENKNIKILLTDKEESGMIGSQHYASKNFNKIKQAIVFDIIGYGDQLVYGTYQDKQFDFLEKYDIKKITDILPSDNLMFNTYKIKTALITAAHKKDLVKNNNELKLCSNPIFYESFHNRKKDNNIDVINFDLIQNLSKNLINIIKNSHI